MHGKQRGKSARVQVHDILIGAEDAAPEQMQQSGKTFSGIVGVRNESFRPWAEAFIVRHLARQYPGPTNSPER